MRGVPFSAVVGSEWTKLWSVRSTWWATGVFVLVVGAVGALAAASTDTADRPEVAVQTALIGFGFGQLALLVVGLLTVTAEFASGSAVSTLTAVPRRTRLLLAKTVVVVVWCLLLAVVLAALCFLAARTLTAVPGGVPPTDPAVLRTLGLQAGAAALVGVLGIALGTVLRSTAGAVMVGTALVLVLPPVLALSGPRWAERLAQALPMVRVGQDAFFSVPTSWPVGMAVVAAWAVGAWVLGAVLHERRDV
ncbi:hypothetical protein SAMN05660662_1490 [Blastococcus aurantiacus]|uniref:ABC-2 family transporter protein n=1 Tax=Blastococcus aurantiacus TaxID=1550231 RepID=A0A1G7JFZ1_9ACTN|nr:hypothetical protein SAMN05660662_1490 [Blastococcus aurantiacus]